jgi:hypothetical protein
MDRLDFDPAQPRPPIIERAYELAASGRFSGVKEISARLVIEGYEQVDLHCEGRAALHAALLRICREAQGRPAVLQVVPPGGATNPNRSSARRFELKAAECHQLADNAKYGETQQTFRRLALTYERLAAHAEQTSGMQEKQKDCS